MDDSVKRRTGETVEDFAERVVLSRRRAVIFIFYIGLLVIVLMFFIRIGVDAQNNRLRLVERTSPVFLGTVKTVLTNGKGVVEKEENVENEERPMRVGDECCSEKTASYFQKHPRELLKRLFW